MEVIKFGGSSLVDAAAMSQVADVLWARRDVPKFVVLSAMGGVTDSLLRAGALAREGSPEWHDIMSDLRRRHLRSAEALLDEERSNAVFIELEDGLSHIRSLCEGIELLREFSPHTRDALVSMGERMSVPIVHALLSERGFSTVRLHALDIVATDNHHGSAQVDRSLTASRLASAMAQAKDVDIVVMEGFVGCSMQGEVTTLGRGGSDLTASLVASMVGAKHMEKSTDVPGMLTADPRLVSSARIIESMSYEEAMELCHFGAKVIYPPTLLPLREAGIPLVIRSTFDTKSAGTTISANPHPGQGVRGVSSIDGMALLTLVGSGMVGIPGYSRRLFMALSMHHVNVVLITQGSSEHSITVAVQEIHIDLALEALRDEFESDLAVGKVEPFRVETGLSILALVGDAMHHHTGISGRAFDALGKNGVNIFAIAQGSTERNISIVIRKQDVAKALRALHGTLFEREVRRIHLFCMGVGNVGGTLLDQIAAAHDDLLSSRSIDVCVVGIANSRKHVMNPEGIDLSRWRETIESKGQKGSLPEFVKAMRELNLENAVFVDNTASEEVASIYEQILRSSIGVVASNKISAADTQARYNELKRLALAKHTQYRFETNVGAGLPVIDTIEHLVQSGDRVHRIDAVLSGTLNYLFSTFGSDCGFVDAVHGAMEAGYTEPDPRIDLSGVDVQRKILILAREAGYTMEMSDIENPGFLPKELMIGSVKDFLDKLHTAEADMQAKLKQAQSNGMSLRYVASFAVDDSGQPRASVGLQSLPPDHAFCKLEGSDNVVMLHTDRYKARPLIVQGAGAGADVTAMGVFADIMRFAATR
ncbi:MAG: bifunctional aspartate kinase/homoserine dehydrogenase I [Bacteroidetes bacterium]|nr:bifunctional aspartate kinase/homoserine dehydrogenase I [Bacteroidota bacterium]MDA0903089.1 bifunctional aspartate kinase/homoserine dehydrogenase I [Bacteroidota bacterium]MDA1241701.1 bifunctional aspartate kinase/homoserine dehydrogenase I [Bacteroidota bacterium]